MPSHSMLTFELSEDRSEVEIHCNAAGINILIAELQKLSRSDRPNHAHLMTPAWAGTELTEELQGAKTSLLNKVTVHLW